MRVDLIAGATQGGPRVRPEIQMKLWYARTLHGLAMLGCLLVGATLAVSVSAALN